ncbi:LemA family protein [Chromatiaceae bacterium AAb-1]|nr:LemA family protein [Chromatiaceae bacterium AAb-1]
MTALIIFAVAAAILAVIIIVIYNGIITRLNAVERAWANVITQERQKNKIIPALEQLTEQYQLYESGVMTQITELRSALQNLSADDVNTASLAQAEQKTTNLIKGLQVAVENYPELKASETFSNLMREISNQQENIGAAIRIFNQNVEDFNNGIETFPNSLVNRQFNRKQKIQTFTDSEAEQGFEYQFKKQ